MKIEGKGPGATPAERLQAIQSRDSATEQQKQAAADALSRTDRVEISAAGRAKSEGVDEGAKPDATRPIPADDPNRLDLIRERVQSGFYASDAVQSAVARQIVARGDHLS